MEDYIIRATAVNGKIRAFAAVTTNLVDEARKTHQLYPVASAALGRVMTSAVMMAADMKGEDQDLSIIIKGDGPLGNLVAVANSSGKIKAYTDNPGVSLPLNEQNKLDVGGAVGRKGKLTVIKDLGLKEPYSGQVDLVTGEIGEDIAYYMAISEQKPSAVSLGVLVNPDGSVKAAGGFIIQPLPGASDELIDQIEGSIANIPPISSMVDEGKSPEEILEILLGSMDLKINQRLSPVFSCDCSRERLESVLLTIGRQELQTILEEDGEAELTCHYCNRVYNFDREDLKEMIDRISPRINFL